MATLGQAACDDPVDFTPVSGGNPDCLATRRISWKSTLGWLRRCRCTAHGHGLRQGLKAKSPSLAVSDMGRPTHKPWRRDWFSREHGERGKGRALDDGNRLTTRRRHPVQRNKSQRLRFGPPCVGCALLRKKPFFERLLFIPSRLFD